MEPTALVEERVRACNARDVDHFVACYAAVFERCPALRAKIVQHVQHVRLIGEP